jgi:predicted PurR-regulated permease PerM
MTETRFRQAFLLSLVTSISAAFVAMIRAFLIRIPLAAIFAGLSYPAYQSVLRKVGGRTALAAIATLVMLLALVMAPLLAVLGGGANEAMRVTANHRAASPAARRSAGRIRQPAAHSSCLPSHQIR